MFGKALEEMFSNMIVAIFFIGVACGVGLTLGVQWLWQVFHHLHFVWS
jgi:hypothetical protein